MSWTDLVILLVMGHFLADFSLQGDRMAVEKCPGRDVVLPWGWWLTAHSSVHGFVVAQITGLPLLGLAECVLHACIDLGKCFNLYRFNLDQSLHILCKLVWAGLAHHLLVVSASV